MAQTRQVVLTTTLIAAAALLPNRFVTVAGKQAAAGELALGVAEVIGDVGDAVAVDVIGITVVEAGAAVAAGVQVEADAQGCAVTHASGKVLGLALDAATAQGDFIRVKLGA